jgi:hypothetical protein
VLPTLGGKIGHWEKNKKIKKIITGKILTTFKLKKFPLLKASEGAVLLSDIGQTFWLC